MADDGEDISSHDPGIRKGEEIAAGDEAGREDTGENPAGRPTGTSNARDYTSVNPQDPIDEDMPHLTES